MKLFDIFRTEEQRKTAAAVAAATTQARKAAAATAATQAAQAAEYNAAAVEDIQELAAAQTAVNAEYKAIYQEAIKHKQDYLNTLAKLKPLEDRSAAQHKQAAVINGYILNPAQRIIINACSSDISNNNHTEPSAYINRAQIRAAYAGHEYATFISSPEV